MSFHRQHGQAFTQSRPQSRRQSHSSSSFYHSPLRDIGGSQHGFEPDAASMIGQLPFEGLDLPLEYEPYPTLKQVQLWDHSSSVSPRQHVHPQRHQNVYDATPLPAGSSRKGKERVTQSPRSRVSSPMEGHESSDKKSQRRLQNRLSQRAYRTRKDKLIETLSLRIQDEIQSRKNMAEACSRKIDACISVFNTQIRELRALQNTLLTDASAHADTGREHGQRDEREVSMDPGEGTVGMGFEFDAGAWGYQF
ncbi:uncharacterized protein PAC_08559 [Phialocephala subalpina]|uniref:BZIP domain-containing protein n=1 Tax=Phialocephala subalpina TaxID=576137 RepID=A0A1L7X0W4_9HELO|nr:uncharacterized protein PAC_08559 [Phialocephala subalpina]